MALCMGEYKSAILISTVVMLITMMPYIYGYSLQGRQSDHAWYCGFAYDIADSSVYHSWIRQASDGYFFQHNLFTTKPQSGKQFNIFFFFLGFLVQITSLPIPVIYHLARFLLGIAFLCAVWWLLGLLLAHQCARMAAFLITCFSSGLGWLPPLWDLPLLESSVDTWQPEAITFLALYFSPLFAVAMLLMVGVIGWLWIAEQRHSYRAAIYAGLCGLLLGNIHTYDVITLVAVWSGLLALRRLVQGKWSVEALRYGFIAGGMTFISTAYAAYLIKTDLVFAKRAAVPTLSPPLLLYLLGYGLVFLLALAGIWVLFKGKAFTKKEDAPAKREELPPKKGNAPKEKRNIVTKDAKNAPEWVKGHDAALLLIVWVTINIAITYIPIPFQRRLLMGEHLPLSALAGIGLAGLSRNINLWKWHTLLTASVLLLFVANGRFLARDIDNLLVNSSMDKNIRPYLYAGEYSALMWIRQHAPLDSAVQPVPWVRSTARGERLTLSDIDITVASYAPGLTGHPVDLGHWGETPDFGDKISSWIYFMQPTTTDEWRQSFLRSVGIRYLLFTQKNKGVGYPTFWNNPPSYLKRIEEASNADADLYEVELK